MRLKAIPAHEVASFWPSVVDRLQAACTRGGDVFSTDFLKHLCEASEGQLIVAHDGNDIHAAAVTQMLVQLDGRLICSLLACGGERAKLWVDLIREIETGAKAKGASSLRFIGRPGWRSLLPDYRSEQVVYEKDL